MNRLRFLKRLSDLREQVGIPSERALGVQAGLGPDLLRQLRTGKNKGIRAENVAKLAAVLGTSVDDLLEAGDMLPSKRKVGAEQADVEVITVYGELQAGNWREAVEWPTAQQRRIALPPDARYPGVKRFGLELVGDSMNLLYPLPKTVVICVRFSDIDDKPQSGKVVVVQRWRHDLVEATCKVLVEREDGSCWLEPRSSSPAYKPVRLVRTKKELAEVSKAKLPAVVHAGHVDDYPPNMDKLEIAALVTGAYVEQ